MMPGSVKRKRILTYISRPRRRKGMDILKAVVFGLFIISSYISTTDAVSSWMYLGVVGVSPLVDQDMGMGTPPQSLADQHQSDISISYAHSVCAALPGLVSRQIEVCQSHPNAIQSVSNGARRAIHQCQYQFRNERWNCTAIEDKQIFEYTIERGSKETAFIYAVTSAGVVHAVTQACSLGNLTECSCDMRRQGRSTPEGWKWGGCSDNLRYGISFSRQFVDAPEKTLQATKSEGKESKNARNLMNLHNNEAGRKAISNLMRMQCRCHGVSGSCEMKTCWRTLPPFNEVGDILKQKYEHAIQVAGRNNEKLLQKKKRHITPLSKSDLVHIHKSPNYCVEDIKKGVLGTSGRVCNKTSTGPDSCDLLCCGRGYNTQVVKQVERCFCKFVWCCSVKCKTCVTMMDVHTCK
uniref:Protein Wnt n=1 Tax=Thamnocephalus platyurus TaxID=91582 RepID=A0A0S1NF01_9CRUS|nr:Wnt16 ligand [Thamnocephalus platyurus]